jgi:hypothetical protein
VICLKRITLGVIAIGLSAALVGATGCSTTGQKASEAPVSVVGSSTVPGQTLEQSAQLNGLVVTFVSPPAAASTDATSVAGKRRYVIRLRAENSTDGTMSVRVVGNAPQLQDANGARVADAKSGTAFGPGVSPLVTAAGRAVRKAAHSDGTVVLPPKKYVTGMIVTTSDPNGHDYVAKWDLGSGRAVAFKLP